MSAVYKPGLKVRVVAGISKGSVGVTTGDVQETEIGVRLVGVLLTNRFRMVRESWLQCLRHEDCAADEQLGVACAWSSAE